MKKNKYEIKKVAVIGGGVMGSGIAAHLANAGIEVLLMDIVPDKMTEEEINSGLSLADKVVRDRIVLSAKEKMTNKKSQMLYIKENIDYIRFCNLEDNLEKLSDMDWVIEVIVENESAKKNLYKKINPYLNDSAILSSNTSSISINELGMELEPELRKRFLGTHFFNPPRFMKLIEIIPSNDTSQEVIDFISNFCEIKLGKGIVKAKDTPGFIANRVGVYALATIMHKKLTYNLTIEEVDALTGAEIGRPKTGTFRLLDMIGNDTVMHVADYLKGNLSESKELVVLDLPDYYKIMVEKGLLGDKKRAGFYKKEGKETLVLDFEDFQYRKKDKVEFDGLKDAKKIKTFSERLKKLIYEQNDVSHFIWDVLKDTLLFAGRMIPEIADDVTEIDNAMKWGYNWEYGPFEIWDIIGVRKSVEKMITEGESIPPIVSELLAKGREKFYDEKPLDLEDKKISAYSLSRKGNVIIGNQHASLVDMKEDIACFVLHSPNSSITDQVVDFTFEAIDEVEKNYRGMVFSSAGKNFCVGANLPYVLENSREKNWKAIEDLVTNFQTMNMALKYSRKPIVGTPFAMTLGGGAEIVMHCHHVRGFSELYMGLVEVGVGVLPAGGGTKEMLLKSMEGIDDRINVDLAPFVTKAFENIIMAKVSSNAVDAKKLGYLRSSDQMTMNQDFLLHDAKKDVIRIEKDMTPKSANKKYRVGGESLLATLKYNLYQLYRGGFISAYDKHIAEKIATVLCGGTALSGSYVTEQDLLDLEKEAFISLCGEVKTQERIENMLKTGKVLRN
ncbi:MAG: 3-hydroxyacyl-CoA dehydrogenase/enoyl-CoA hydratase family protein [Eubacteriales bacterium]|nr:3-hydroxyacyl-CoA dehydrogenase/enoyl-CoA hydratase family protein [Eubacteriales bacterium]